MFSKYKYTAPKADSPIFSIDCEMVSARHDGNRMRTYSCVPVAVHYH